jgi:hypothetical protein
VSKIIKATLDAQNQVHYQGPPPRRGNYKVLIAILDEPEEEAIYSALTPVASEPSRVIPCAPRLCPRNLVQ